MHPYMLMHKYNISGRIYLKLFPYSWERHGGLLLSALYLFFLFLHSNKPHVSFICITERKSKFLKSLPTAFPLAFWPKFAQSPLQRDCPILWAHV